jgi:hypothetical protein
MTQVVFSFYQNQIHKKNTNINYGNTQINNTCNLKYELVIVLYHVKISLNKQQLSSARLVMASKF